MGGWKDRRRLLGRAMLIALAAVASCSEAPRLAPPRAMSASEPLCAYVIAFERREDADRLIARSSAQVAEAVRDNRLFVLRSETELTLVHVQPAKACAAESMPFPVEVEASRISAFWMTAGDVEGLIVQQYAFHGNEQAPRQCIVTARLVPARDELADMEELHFFRLASFRASGVYRPQVESANGVAYVASDSSCAAVLAVVGAANSRTSQRIDAQVCEHDTLAECGFPNQIGIVEP